MSQPSGNYFKIIVKIFKSFVQEEMFNSIVMEVAGL